MSDSVEKRHRRIRSFVLREGRMTPSQQRAMDELWPQFGLDPNQALDLEATFGRQAPATLEIGFGNGDSLAQMALAEPERDFIGIEVHGPGVGHLLLAIEKHQLTNVRVYRHDAVEVLERCIEDAGLDRLQLYFPDPWHKKRHHKRRIVQTPFADLVAQKLAPQGHWHIATDWQDYAEHCLEILEPHSQFKNTASQPPFIERPEWRPLTKFEQRGQRLGHGVWDLLYQRCAT
ncbi:tRNA (guanine-N(7)-)-methyltransferase [gamma proteobacterium HTCC5015]|nr:tRNA (guanine-N(7)-)-methyltransferase [gamma proteobacterium HTCC5015]